MTVPRREVNICDTYFNYWSWYVFLDGVLKIISLTLVYSWLNLFQNCSNLRYTSTLLPGKIKQPSIQLLKILPIAVRPHLLLHVYRKPFYLTKFLPLIYEDVLFTLLRISIFQGQKMSKQHRSISLAWMLDAFQSFLNIGTCIIEYAFPPL